MVKGNKNIDAENRMQGWEIAAVLVSGFVFFVLFMWLRASVFHEDLPKTALLRHRNAEWSTRLDKMSRQLDQYDEILSMVEERDERIYRSVYGLDGIPQEVRRSAVADAAYPSLEGTALSSVIRRLDVLEKRAFMQSRSFDEVSALQKTAGDLASHIPAIPPISTDVNTYRLSSPFGYRSHPILGFLKLHTGMDFACDPGNPVYATGDGVVVKADSDLRGYGKHVEIDHGFGYRTRYAHMSRLDVAEGQQVKRGDCIGLTGRSGMVSGPHLHYEIIYRKDYVNPALYMDLSIPPDDYALMVKKPQK